MEQMTSKAAASSSLSSTQLPHTERHFDYMLHRYWEKDGNCYTLATHLCDRVPNDEPSTSYYPFVLTKLFVPHNRSQIIDPTKSITASLILFGHAASLPYIDPHNFWGKGCKKESAAVASGIFET